MLLIAQASMVDMIMPTVGNHDTQPAQEYPVHERACPCGEGAIKGLSCARHCPLGEGPRQCIKWGASVRGEQDNERTGTSQLCASPPNYTRTLTTELNVLEVHTK